MSDYSDSEQEEFVSYIVKRLVDKPDEINVSIEHENDSNKSIVKILANPSDYGKIIGRKGRIINSIRSLFTILVRDSDRHWVIDVPDKQ